MIQDGESGGEETGKQFIKSESAEQEWQGDGYGYGYGYGEESIVVLEPKQKGGNEMLP